MKWPRPSSTHPSRFSDWRLPWRRHCSGARPRAAAPSSRGAGGTGRHGAGADLPPATGLELPPHPLGRRRPALLGGVGCRRELAVGGRPSAICPRPWGVGRGEPGLRHPRRRVVRATKGSRPDPPAVAAFREIVQRRTDRATACWWWPPPPVPPIRCCCKPAAGRAAVISIRSRSPCSMRA